MTYTVRPCTRSLPYLSFYLNDPAPTKIYTLSLHDALPICGDMHAIALGRMLRSGSLDFSRKPINVALSGTIGTSRSEEHTSELQSHVNLVCRLLLEKKKNTTNIV